MDLRLPITVYARDGEGNAGIDILVKSDSGISHIDIAIESGANRSSIRLEFDQDGKSSLVVDSAAIELLAQRVIVETARTVLETGILSVHGNEIDLKADSILNLLSQVSLRLGAPDLQIGAGALSVTSTAATSIKAANILMEIFSASLIKSPDIALQGLVKLGTGDMRPIARVGDQVQVFGVETGGGTATGTIISGGSNLSS